MCNSVGGRPSSRIRSSQPKLLQDEVWKQKYRNRQKNPGKSLPALGTLFLWTLGLLNGFVVMEWKTQTIVPSWSLPKLIPRHVDWVPGKSGVTWACRIGPYLQTFRNPQCLCNTLGKKLGIHRDLFLQMHTSGSPQRKLAMWEAHVTQTYTCNLWLTQIFPCSLWHSGPVSIFLVH